MLDVAVLIGRFQPFHNGHQAVLDFALTKAHQVIVGIGSSNLHVSPKNPFTYEQRVQMIRAVYGRRWRDGADLDTYSGRLLFTPINDAPDKDSLWITGVGEAVARLTNHAQSIGIVHFTDGSATADGRWFPHWERIELPHRTGTISASAIRELYFHDAPRLSTIGDHVDWEVKEQLKRFSLTAGFQWLLKEAKFLKEYAEEYGPGPFLTGDAVVEQSGHVLLVTRKNPPYAGALALPGGFMNERDRPGEPWDDVAFRELREETRIEDHMGKMSMGALKKYVKSSHVFDLAGRDPRARIITKAFHLELPKSDELYKVLGDDDAEKACWYELATLKPTEFACDHWFIIQHFMGK